MIATEIPTRIGGRIRIFQRQVTAMNSVGHKKYTEEPEPLTDDRIGEEFTHIRVPENVDVGRERYDKDPLFNAAIELACEYYEFDWTVDAIKELAGQEFRFRNEAVGLSTNGAYGRDNTPTVRATEKRPITRRNTTKIGCNSEKQPKSLVVRLIHRIRSYL